MNNNSNVMLVTQTHVKAEKNYEFAQWQEKISETVSKFPGHISQTISPPNPPVQLDWVIKQHFVSAAAAKAWLQSDERKELIKQILPLTIGIDNIYIIEEKNYQTAVTATISTIIHSKDEQKFLDWNARIAPIQSKFPGFIGYKLERPRRGVNDTWITIITFDNNEHLENWLKSEERKKLLDELNAFSIKSNLRKTFSGFDFWFSQSKDSEHSAWKENMLVLLTLYPVIFLLSFIQKPVMEHGMPFWLALFFSNALSTIILGWFTVPWLIKTFSWWLNPKKEVTKKYNILGISIVLLLYGLSLFICWLISKYL